MALQPGTRLGPYEILAPLGAGGMGEVYRARDTRLGRDVAVKVLPQDVSASPEDRARFKREAKTISSLNHPHICTLHDVGQEGDIDYLVMELVDGETLAQRIARGPLPQAEVLRIGTQIADALDRAHRAGVIHRDLKPGNVMLTKSGAKLMDFGLARVARDARRGRATEATATTPAGTAKSDEPITAKGMIVGTIQYMAPEQLEGKNADTRTDLWALGCVLYEMATGRRAFEGASPASLISAIMRDQPRRMMELAPMAPPAFERAVRQCLAKDPDDRWQSSGDLRRELLWISEAGSEAGVPLPVAARRHTRERIAWAVATVALVGLGTTLLQPKRAQKTVSFDLVPPSRVGVVDLPRISPDGLTLAFNAVDTTGVSCIWVRRMDSVDARRLQGTEGASRPFWSPDSRYLAFFAGDRLLKIGVAGGPPIPLCDAPRGSDGSWSRKGVILFDGGVNDSIQMVSASGGTPVGATRFGFGSGWPQFLPDGRHFLYISARSGSDIGTLTVGSIDSKETESLGPAPSRAEYALGNVLYVVEGALVARRFDAGALKFTGEPVAVAQDVEARRGGAASFSVSSEGTLVYHSAASPPSQRFVWVSRRGDRLGTLGGPGYYSHAMLSPDETRLALTVGNATQLPRQIWTWDVARDQGSRLSATNRDTNCPAWSPDGSRVLYVIYDGPHSDLVVQQVGSASAESLLLRSSETVNGPEWSTDGRWIVYAATVPPNTNNLDILTLRVGDTARPKPIVATRFLDASPVLSPDGKWMAYASLEWGQWQVYVQPFPDGSGRQRISTKGGEQPAWRGDGRELYYVAPDAGLMAVGVEPGSPPRFLPPRKLFIAPVVVPSEMRTTYLPTRSGQRFLLICPDRDARVGATTIVLNWPALLPK